MKGHVCDSKDWSLSKGGEMITFRKLSLVAPWIDFFFVVRETSYQTVAVIGQEIVKAQHWGKRGKDCLLDN